MAAAAWRGFRARTEGAWGGLSPRVFRRGPSSLFVVFTASSSSTTTTSASAFVDLLSKSYVHRFFFFLSLFVSTSPGIFVLFSFIAGLMSGW